jgi:hypothetical protein
MAKVTIELDLSKEEDLRDYNLYNNAGGMFDALFEISCNLKRKVSYQFDGDDNGAFDLVFEMIADILEENNVIIDKLN